VNLSLDPADLRPLVQAVVTEALDQLRRDEARLDGRLAFPEPEAASLVGVKPHVLRDARLRGEITATRIGKRIAYERSELLDYLRRNREQ